MAQTQLSEDEASQLLARRLTTILRDLPPAYERLKLFRQPGSRPSDTGSRQRHGDAVRDVLVATVEDLLNERVKPGTYPVRSDPARGIDQTLEDLVWDPERGDEGEWVVARRQGVLPTLTQWCRLIDGDMWDAGVEHEEYGLASCGRLCWMAPVRARTDQREGPCSQHPESTISPAAHWTAPTVADDCAWLTNCAPWIFEHNWPDDNRVDEAILADLRRLLGDIQAVTGDFDRTGPLRCLNCGNPVDEKKGGAWYTCRGCGKSWGRLELHRMAERKKPKTLAELEGPTGLSIVTLRRYEDAGEFEALPVRRGTAKLYDLDQVMEATQRERYKPQRGATGRFQRKSHGTPSRTV